MNKIIYTTIILISFTLTGCFDWLNKDNKAVLNQNSTSAITSADFSGVTSATNKVTGVLLSWTAVANTSLVKAYNVYRVAGSKKTLLSSVSPSLTSFMDGSVVWGTVYSYQVNAVDTEGIEDSNSKTVKVLSWAGISSVTASSRTSLVVNFENLASVVDEIRVYGQQGVGGTKTLLATGNGSSSAIEITGLLKGYPYIISAQAYVSSLGKEDGNDVTFSASTKTIGYDDDGSDAAQWGNVIQIRAFGEAPGAPTDPNGTNKSPRERVVELAFKSFSSMGSSAKYVVTRVADGQTLDSSAAVYCSNTTTTSCLVCSDLTASNGVVTCRDLNVAASPARYRYSLSLQQTDATSGSTWIEALPSDDATLEKYSVLVPIPPKNMTLVQRDAANYEMCLQLNKSPDPANHNRCIYSGVGAVPYSTGHNKPPLTFDTGYYDFGYNLFVDRWQMSCDWTSAVRGGMCGDNHTSGDCIGAAGSGTYPSSSLGAVGDVFYLMGSGTASECFYAYSKDSSTGAITWKRPTEMTALDNAAIWKKMFTSDPGYLDAQGNYDTSIPGRRGKIGNYGWMQVGHQVCSAQTDSSYGIKRLSRAREYVVWSAPSIISGEFYPFSSYSVAWNYYLLGTQSHSVYLGCDTSVATYDPATYTTTTEAVTGLLNNSTSNASRNMTMFKISGTIYGYREYMIGAPETVDCQSRYGVQDIVTSKWMNDVTYYNSTTQKSTGMASPYDNGNRDFLADFYGTQTGFAMDATKFNGTLYSTSANFTGFIPTLGWALTSTGFSADYWVKNAITQPYGLYNAGALMPATSASSSINATIGRYRWAMRYDTSTTSGNAEAQCVLPAE